MSLRTTLTTALALATTATTLLTVAPSATAADTPAPAASSCTPVTRTIANPSVRTANEDGPRSPIGRPVAPTQIACPTGATVMDVDFGDVALGNGFRSPMRGVLVVPRNSRNAPLVVVSHLRGSGCADNAMSYPCVGGRERRLDRGMTYLGVDLARKGYAVLIPDLAPLYVGQHMGAPYDQFAGWQKLVGGLRDRLVHSVQGTDRSFGMPLTGRVDTRKAGLFVHSRSGYEAGPAIRAWSTGPTKIVTVLAYGPAYDTDPGKLTPMLPDVPYLSLVGTDDQDVPFNAFRWIDAHLSTRRVEPALVAAVNGYGHNYANRALSAAKSDDRTSCTGPCASAGAHEQLVSRTSALWFDRTLIGKRVTGLPINGRDALPTTISGVPAKWLALTNGRRAIVFDGDRGRRARLTNGQMPRLCRFFEAMDPTQSPQRCADPDNGTVNIAGRVLIAPLSRTAGVVLPTDVPVSRAREVVLHVSPFGDRTDGRPTSVRVTVITTDGRRVVVDAPTSGALANLGSSAGAGNYPIRTVRIALPQWVYNTNVKSVTLTSGTAQNSTLVVRQVDLA